MARPPKDGLFQQNGSAIWYCRWHDADGQLHRRSTGKTDAAQAYQVYKMLRIAAGCKPTQPNQPTVTDILDIYHRERGKHSKTGGYNYAIQQLTAFYINVEWEDLGKKGNPHRLAEYIKHRQASGAKAGTINKEIMYLSAAANIAIDDGLDIKNHAAGKKLDEPTPQYYWLTPEQGKALLIACQYDPNHKYANPSPHLLDYVIIALGTGMRPSEILTLTRQQIDLTRRVILLPTTKAAKPHEIPMSEEVITAVRSCLNRSTANWLFYNAHTQTHVNSMRLQFRAACIRAGIPVTDRKQGTIGVRGYDTRHSCATWLLQAGASLEEIGDLLNHADPRTTKRYAHHGLNGRRATVNKLPKL